MINLVFRRLGVIVEVRGEDLFVPGGQELRVQNDLRGEIPYIDDAPWPGFPADLMSIALTVATQASGTLIMFEKMFDGRLFFVDKLNGMGARIILCDPHRAVIIGPSRLHGEELSSPDIRAGMAILLAALAADGVSVIRNVQQIDRGYERIEQRLQALGARIERVADLGSPLPKGGAGSSPLPKGGGCSSPLPQRGRLGGGGGEAHHCPSQLIRPPNPPAVRLSAFESAGCFSSPLT